MIQVVLYQPEIPQNTGNIIRLCANTGAHLHLIHPLGFTWDDKKLRRAGLDYHEFAEISHYQDYQAFEEQHPHANIYACTTHAQQYYTSVAFKDHDMLLFGAESRGLTDAIRQKSHNIRIPMLAHSRSLNLSNAVAVIVFEALRQLQFPGAV